MSAGHNNLWSSNSQAAWLAALDAYDSVITNQKVAKLQALVYGALQTSCW